MSRERVVKPLPKAAEGESWLLVWQEPEIRDFRDEWNASPGKLIKRSSVTLLKAALGNFSPYGLGTIDLQLSTLPALPVLDAGVLAGALAGCPHLGRGSYLDRGAVFNLMRDVPDKLAVRESREIEQILQAFESVKGSRKINMSRFQADPNYRHSSIMPNEMQGDDEDYGLLWVPKGSEQALNVVERTHPVLSDTHTLVDLLGTKHQLMRRLGFDEAIELDLRLIQNRAEYDEQQRRRGGIVG